MILFDEKYDGESIVDVERDVLEAFDTDFNPLLLNIPQDEHGFCKGTFKVTVEWSLEDHNINEAEEELRKLNQGESVVMPKNKEHAESMLRIAAYYLDHSVPTGKE